MTDKALTKELKTQKKEAESTNEIAERVSALKKQIRSLKEQRENSHGSKKKEIKKQIRDLELTRDSLREKQRALEAEKTVKKIVKFSHGPEYLICKFIVFNFFFCIASVL